jgi:hypothetical protein
VNLFRQTQAGMETIVSGSKHYAERRELLLLSSNGEI